MNKYVISCAVGTVFSLGLAVIINHGVYVDAPSLYAIPAILGVLGLFIWKSS